MAGRAAGSSNSSVIMDKAAYVLVSACRNEENFIAGLIDTIAAQTVRPARWVIVDDGSTDGTHERAVRHAAGLPFVEIVRMPGGRPRSFASQVYAAQHGAGLVAAVGAPFIGFLDADIRLPAYYYERLLERFAGDERLGLAGGIVVDQYPDRQENIRQGSEHHHVAGGVQCFRRECFEQIGGYVVIDGGGQDTIADVMAMMHGWRICSFADLPAIHLRPEGFTRDGVWLRGMKWGRKFYLIGYDPVFYFGQCLRRAGRRPLILGSLCQAIGYVAAAARRERRPVSGEFVKFLRASQRRRLMGTLGLRGRADSTLAASPAKPTGCGLAV